MISVELNKILEGINIIVNMAKSVNTPLYEVEWWISKDVLTLLELDDWIDKRDNTLKGIEVGQVIVNDCGIIKLMYKNRGAR